MKFFIDSVAVLGPGLNGWRESQSVLAGSSEFAFGEMPKFVPEMLPPTERRRCGASARLSIHVAHETLKDTDIDPSSVATVFASSGGDTEISQKICLALAEPDRFVSPTLFHNSVHNAAVGYWCIAAGSRKSSNSLSAYDWSVAGGLLAAGAQVCVERERVLLVCYEVPVSEPMHSARPVLAPFAAGLLLSPEQSAISIAAVDVTHLRDAEPVTISTSSELEKLRLGNSAARILPLLSLLACGAGGKVVLEEAMDSRLHIEVSPCP